jgi:hypothetical protein
MRHAAGDFLGERRFAAGAASSLMSSFSASLLAQSEPVLLTGSIVQTPHQAAQARDNQSRGKS